MLLGIGHKRPDPPMPKVPTEKVTIVSVLPRVAFNQQVAGRYFELYGCPKCELHDMAPCAQCDNYAALTIGAVVEGVDTPMSADGSGRELKVIQARDIAESLVNAECSDRGVFIAAGPEPTSAELAKARETFVSWGKTLVNKADDIWGAKKDAKLIDPRAHDCAKYLGLSREWLSNTAPQVACRICGRYAKTGVIMGECNHPIDWKKAQQVGLLTPQMEKFGLSEGLLDQIVRVEEPPVDLMDAPFHRGPGRPRKIAPIITDPPAEL